MPAISELAMLRSEVDRAAQIYYRPGGEEKMSDSEYDQLLAKLREACPDDLRLTRVGIPYSADELRNKVEHTIPMGSLDNTDGGIEGFADWYSKACQLAGLEPDGAAVHVSFKLDGSSVAAYYEDGELQRVVGRGNGEVGEDLTANAVRWLGVPTSVPSGFTGVVRGEAILYKDEFDKVNKFNATPAGEISNPRNVGNGILGRSDGRHNEYIRFTAFNILSQNPLPGSLSDKLGAARDLGFVTVEDAVFGEGVVERVAEFFRWAEAERDNLLFGIDGIVVCLDVVELQEIVTRDRKDALRPRYARAVKFTTLKNETTVKGITLTVGHTGAIIPTAQLEPVRVGGVTVSSALLNNWNAGATSPTAAHVKIGDTVVVELAGDIIPKICEVSGSSSDSIVAEEPAACPACGADTTRVHRGKEGVVTYCSDPDRCSAASIYRVKHFIGTSKKGMGILGIGDAVLEAMFDAGCVEVPADLYSLTVADIEDLVIGASGSTGASIRLGSSRAATITAEIQKAKRVPLIKFLGALGIDLLGRRRAEIIAKEQGLITLEDWLDAERLATIPGDTIRQSITDGLSKSRDLIDDLLAAGVEVLPFGEKVAVADPKPSDPVDAPALSGDNQFAGKTFCFTGTRAHLDEVEARGGILKSGISKTLNFLVQKDATSLSNKTRKAESYGVKIIGIACLEAVLKGERDLPEVG